MGHTHDKPNCRCHTRPRRPRPRLCLRKGCGRLYQPRRFNQRYCQDPECLRLLRRWQAARRQARRRLEDAVKAQHAQAQRCAPSARSSAPQPPKKHQVAAARGHVATIFLPHPLCQRPGCYAPPPKSGRNQARYCCPACRQAVRRVLDRERKWRSRGTFRGRRARALEYAAARARRAGPPHDTASPAPPQTPPP